MGKNSVGCDPDDPAVGGVCFGEGDGIRIYQTFGSVCQESGLQGPTWAAFGKARRSGS